MSGNIPLGNGARVTDAPSGQRDPGNTLAGISAVAQANDKLARGIGAVGDMVFRAYEDMADNRNKLQSISAQTYLFEAENADNTVFESEINRGDFKGPDGMKRLKVRYEALRTNRLKKYETFIKENVTSPRVAEHLLAAEKQAAARNFAHIGGRFLSINMNMMGRDAWDASAKGVANRNEDEATAPLNAMRSIWGDDVTDKAIEKARVAVQTGRLDDSIAFGDSIANPELQAEYFGNLQVGIMDGSIESGYQDSRSKYLSLVSGRVNAAIKRRDTEARAEMVTMDAARSEALREAVLGIENSIDKVVFAENEKQLKGWMDQTDAQISASGLTPEQKEHYRIRTHAKFNDSLDKMNKQVREGWYAQNEAVLDDATANNGQMSLYGLDEDSADAIMKSRNMFAQHGARALEYLDDPEYARYEQNFVGLMREVDAYSKAGDKYGERMRSIVLRAQFLDDRSRQLAVSALNNKVKGIKINDSWDAASEKEFSYNLDGLVSWYDEPTKQGQHAVNALEFYEFRNSIVQLAKVKNWTPTQAFEEVQKHPFYKKAVSAKNYEDAAKIIKAYNFYGNY